MNHHHKRDLSLSYQPSSQNQNNLFDELIADNESESRYWIPGEPDNQSENQDQNSNQSENQHYQQNKAIASDHQYSNLPQQVRDPNIQVPQGYYTVEKIVAKKIENKKIFYKVKWLGYDSKLNTWEPIDNLTNVNRLIDEFQLQYVKNGTDTKKERKKAKKISKSNQDSQQKVDMVQEKELPSQQLSYKNISQIQISQQKQKQSISETLLTAEKKREIIQIEDSSSDQNILSTAVTPIQTHKKANERIKNYEQIPNKKGTHEKLNQAKRTNHPKLVAKDKIQSPKKSQKIQSLELCQKSQHPAATEKKESNTTNESSLNPILLNIERPKLCYGNINHYVVLGKQVKYEVDIQNEKGNVIGVKLVSGIQLKTHHSSKLRKFLQTYLTDVHRYEEDLEKFFQQNPLQSSRNQNQY